MSALVYQNTKTNIPNWKSTLHQSQPRGMAYIQDDFFVHIYGYSTHFWTVSTGLTASQQREGDLKNWVIDTFGAEDIKPSKNAVGEVVEGVWRPGLYYKEEVHQALKISEHEQWSSEQTLKMLVDKLDEILLYIEPSQYGLNAYSHKTRELLLLACTELENTWQQYLRNCSIHAVGKKSSTADYVRLCSPLFLDEYEVKLKPYKQIVPIRPFAGWSDCRPSQSLSWYDAYNKTKHDRNLHFDKATLQNCIHAVAGNIILFCVRYSPYPLFQAPSSLTAIINQLFEITLVNPNPATFYIPKIIFSDRRTSLVCGGAKDDMQVWVTNPLKL